jgi:hypothetical protein
MPRNENNHMYALLLIGESAKYKRVGKNVFLYDVGCLSAVGVYKPNCKRGFYIVT